MSQVTTQVADPSTQSDGQGTDPTTQNPSPEALRLQRITQSTEYKRGLIAFRSFVETLPKGAESVFAELGNFNIEGTGSLMTPEEAIAAVRERLNAMSDALEHVAPGLANPGTRFGLETKAKKVSVNTFDAVAVIVGAVKERNRAILKGI